MSTSSQTRTGPARPAAAASSVLPVNRVRLLARQAVTVALDLLFPPHCVSCQRVGSFLCPKCLASVTPGRARVVAGLDGVEVRADYDGAIRAAIHAFKYDGQTRLVTVLGALLYEAVRRTDWPIGLVTAVPLHAARLRERGYNQAALLADYVARLGNWPFEAAAMQRVRDTASQVHLNAQERRVNVAGAFAADPALVRGQCVLIVDDVLTTGATLAACADALRAAGATQVYAATLAGAVYAEPLEGAHVTRDCAGNGDGRQDARLVG